ncbi:MAG: N-acetylmuramoyl-L-alanine amidase [Saprospirales bacterium]|nr:N-acetylmuramoyl-L-alanine amidase [Saprospirales bacterium]MBK8492914.1 N-acetylmuramoyl-L-alanine amidase [Saprospirales bacterium]
MGGLYDYGARWYMADLGRWGAVDPLAEVYHSTSAYIYGGSNPILMVDPNGMSFFSSTFLNAIGGYWTDNFSQQEGSGNNPPENENNDPVKIATDAGHGEKIKGSCCVDPGAVSGDSYEKDFALLIEEQVAKFLSRFGNSVTRTRTEDVIYPGDRLTWRLKKAAGSDILISIHLDAGEKAGMFVMYDGNNPNSRDLAIAIAQNQTILPLEGQGYFTPGEKGRGNLRLLSGFKGEASVIIELGGIGNVQTKKAIIGDAGLIGLQIAVGVTNYLQNE